MTEEDLPTPERIADACEELAVYAIPVFDTEGIYDFLRDITYAGGDLVYSPITTVLDGHKSVLVKWYRKSLRAEYEQKTQAQ